MDAHSIDSATHQRRGLTPLRDQPCLADRTRWTRDPVPCRTFARKARRSPSPWSREVCDTVSNWSSGATLAVKCGLRSHLHATSGPFTLIKDHLAGAQRTPQSTMHTEAEPTLVGYARFEPHAFRSSGSRSCSSKGLWITWKAPKSRAPCVTSGVPNAVIRITALSGDSRRIVASNVKSLESGSR